MGGRTAGKTGLSVVVRRGVAIPEGAPPLALGGVLPYGRSVGPRGVTLPGVGGMSFEGRGLVGLPDVEAVSGISCFAMGCQAPATATTQLCIMT